MPAASTTPRNIFFVCLSGLALLWLLGFFTSNIMDSISSPFTIEIDGKPIAKIDQGAEDHTRATLGDEAAVFSLKNKKLQCGDWIVGRDLTENRSFLPKTVSWYKATPENEERVQPVTAKKDGDAYQLIFSNGKLMVEDGAVLVDLLGDAQSQVKIILQ